MPDKFDFDKPRRYKFSLDSLNNDSIRRVPFEISCIAANTSALVAGVAGDIFRKSIFRGNQEIQTIAESIQILIAPIVILGIAAGIGQCMDKFITQFLDKFYKKN